jgi:beta,beta-carotene 9',10'-dioxygenase
VSSEQLADTDLELPRIDYRRRNGRPYRYVYGAALNGSWLAKIVKVDIERGETSAWSADGCWPGEPVFVPEPDSEDEDAGVLLSIVLDGARERSFLLVLDAATLEEIARAEVPHAVPFSFHGQFFGA